MSNRFDDPNVYPRVTTLDGTEVVLVSRGGFGRTTAISNIAALVQAQSGVASVAGRTGVVTLSVGDVSGAYASSNPAGYITTAALAPYALTSSLSVYALTSSLAAVATSGSYADLTNKPSTYSLPTSSTTILGGVKVDGTTITITNGVISATTGGSGTITGVTAGTGLTGGGTTGTVTLNVAYGTTSTTAAAGDDSRITGAAQKASNLSDLASASTARSTSRAGHRGHPGVRRHRPDREQPLRSRERQYGPQ
jgi:hypothetical protein